MIRPAHDRPPRPKADETQISRRFIGLFHKILKTAVAGEASDVHLKIGTPVVLCIHREFLAIECHCPMEGWMSRWWPK